MTLHLIQPRELFGPPERWEELCACWDKNAAVFDEVTIAAGRPTFAELFALCKPGAINVICNSDIYFDSSIAICERIAPGQCFALSRWDVKPDGSAELWDHADSQDAWVFDGKPEGINTRYNRPDGITADISLGVPGCDNAIAHRIKQAGYELLNPSRTIKAFHLHNVQWRSYLHDPKGRARGGNKIERIPPQNNLGKPAEL